MRKFFTLVGSVRYLLLGTGFGCLLACLTMGILSRIPEVNVETQIIITSISGVWSLALGGASFWAHAISQREKFYDDFQKKKEKLGKVA